MTSSTRSGGGRMLAVAAGLVRLAGLARLVAMAARGEWVNAALFSLVLLGLVLPRILALVVAVGPGLDLVYGVVLLFAAWSAVLDLYVTYNWLDVLVHAVACGLTAVVAYRLLAAWSVLPCPDDPGVRHASIGLVVTTTAVGWALGVLWEVGEWFGHTYLDHRIQVGYGDTIGDLMADGEGAFAAGLLLAWTFRSTSPRNPSSGTAVEHHVTVSV